MEVYIDGTLVDTINQYSAIATWQNRWNSPVLPSGPHTVTLKHASGGYVELDAVIVSGPATTATPTITPTVTPTITGTLTGTPIPTETPPPPLLAEYFYDGDGNMVKAVVNDVVTYYPGRLQ
jgi:hypothetical protein